MGVRGRAATKGDDAPRKDAADPRPIAPPRFDDRRFKPELTPTWLHLATLLGGHRPLDLTGTLRIVHLGSGAGFTPAVTAAVHPGSAVWWWDPDVAAVEAARRLRDAAGLANLTVHERADLPPGLGGGPADLVVVDGLLDTAGDSLHTELLDAVVATLRPGGLVCFTYRTEVGWGEVAPVHHLIRHLVAAQPRPAADVIDAVRDLLRQLRAGGAQYLTQRPVVASWLDEALALPPDDLIHQVVDQPLRPLSHARLLTALDHTGLVHVGPARPADLVDPRLSRRLAELVAGAPSAVLHETLSDLALRRTHRADVFRLGAAPLAGRDRQRELGDLRLTGQGCSPAADAESAGPLRAATARALSQGAVHVHDLAPGAPEQEAILRRLVSSGRAHPLNPLPWGAEATAAVQRLNAVVSRPPVRPAARVLAAPALGSAVGLATKPTRGLQITLGIR